MNWTGGTLQRTKTANKGVIQKQRAYFARARTRLQQCPDTLTHPFCPDFLQEGDDCRYKFRIPSSASGPGHATGHSARKYRAREVRHTLPTARKQGRTDGQGGLEEASPHFQQNTSRNIDGREEQRGLRGKHAATDPETQLLEANKKRLLKQSGWIGFTPSIPVGQYSAVKEKPRVGKRRKVDGKSRPATCRSPVTFLHRTGQDELGNHFGAYMSGALPVLAAADDIRVRIGSDALTTIPSTQPFDYAPSQTNSDSMLFDEEVNGAAHRKQSEVLQDEPSSGHKLMAGPRSPVAGPAKLDRNCSPQDGLPRNYNLTRRPETHADGHMQHNAADRTAFDQADLQSAATDPSFRLSHRVGGMERPFKFIFEGPSTGRIVHAASPKDEPVETQSVRANLHAEGIERGHTPRNVGEAHRIAFRRQPSPPLIDDTEPWRPYLYTGISSPGQVRSNDWAGMSVLQPHVPVQDRRAESTLRPQHGVQGNLTHANLLTVSASLPVPKQPSARLLDARPLPRADLSKGFGNDEAFWRSYAIGSDPQSAVETIHTCDATSEGSISWATKGYASTRLPLSTAVTPVSSTPFPSTPFKSLSGQASRISDEVQHARRSGSRSILSAAPSHTVWGGVDSPYGEDVPGDEQGDKTSAGSLFGEHSTHASLQNHASQVTAMSSDTRMSRSDLDRHSRARGDVSRLAQAGGSSIIWRRDSNSSTWDSDGAGIDLVDAERWT